MHSTKFINKSSQTIQIILQVLEKMIDFYEIFYKMNRSKAAGIWFSTHPGVLVKPETYNLSICENQANSDCIKRLSPIFGTEW